MKKWERLCIGGMAVVSLLILWEVVTLLGLVKVANISRPSLVVKALVELSASGEVFHHLAVSLKGFIIGFILALLVGIPGGLVIGRYRVLALLFDPMLMALYTMPRLAMMPILVVWFGVGLGATIAVVFLGAVFPILVNTAVGVREVDPIWVRAVHSFGGNEWDIFIKVLLPGAVPPIMTGIRLGIGRGLLGMVVSEMFASYEGIGRQISLYGESFQVAELMALIAIVSLLGLLSVNLMQWIEKRIRWGRMEMEV